MQLQWLTSSKCRKYVPLQRECGQSNVTVICHNYGVAVMKENMHIGGSKTAKKNLLLKITLTVSVKMTCNFICDSSFLNFLEGISFVFDYSLDECLICTWENA